jgi:hypothetical protein
MRFWPLEVLTWGDNWVIVVRVDGDVDTREEGQNRWEPVFHKRRLNDLAKVRISEHAKAILSFPDGSELHLKGPVEVRFIDSSYPCYDISKVIDMRARKVGHSILLFFGKQYRFEVKHPNGIIGARG